MRPGLNDTPFLVGRSTDIETLKLFTWQEKSSIIDLKGNIKEFDADMQRWFNEMLGVR